MRYIKIFISVLLLFVITGCTKEYRLYINDDGITESFHMVADSDNPYLYVLDGDFYPLHNDFDHKFKKELKVDGVNKIIDLEYKYSFEDFVYANSFNQCFDDRKIIFKDSDYYIIKLRKPNGCMFQEDYTINIITDNEVVENNADKIKGNKYIWYVKNADKDNFKLRIKIRKSKSKNVKKDGVNSLIGYLILGFAFVGIMIIIYIAVKKIKKKNQM